jgi:hypothetical protein
MDSSTAKKLIQETFEEEFNRDQFRKFILNLLNNVEETPNTTYKGNTIPKAYQQYVKIMDRLGKYEDKEGKSVDILIIHLKKESSLERARTMQRNLVGWYLNGSRGGVLKDGALVAFVSPNPEDWRFSFVKMDYEFVEKEGGGVKAEQTFTPARRFSFLVGENEYSHTAQKQLIPILKKDVEKPAFKEIEEGFSVEPVTERFYKEYRDRFLELKEELDKFVEKDATVREDFQEHNVDTSDFAKKLMGQIVFLYFLQKKGWFGVARDEDWGSGPKNFLRELFEKKHASYSNFFNDILEPLFYEALATQRPDDYYSRFNCKIPFLNGGLFDPIQNYDWINTDLLLPDTLFSNADKTGILDVFDRYNFTIKENEPLEKEVAVDPEMLGKVFENLLKVGDRKTKGTFYTPREIVHFMCQESLISYLDHELANTIPTKDINVFVRFGEQAIDNDRYIKEKEQETQRYTYDIPESIRENAELIDDKLASIRVCDPAVGSGAFLVGMMNEIVRKREVLTSYHPHVSNRNAYKFKHDSIHNSLYGVDIDPGAVEIAKLRLWLSLVVEEENIKRIHSLPNLDYKIMQGNSLLEEYEGIKLIDERFFAKPESNEHVIEQLREQEKKIQREYIQLHQEGNLTAEKGKELQKRLKKIPKKIKQYQKQEANTGVVSDLFGSDQARIKAEQLLELQDDFFDASRQQEKQTIKSQIDTLTWDLIELTLIEQDKKDKLKKIKKFRDSEFYPFFLWRLNFAEVFQDKGGFDLIIGNPPYLESRSPEFSAEMKDRLQNAVKRRQGPDSKYITRGSDLLIYFFEISSTLIKPEGNIVFITQNSWLDTVYGRKFQKFITKKTNVEAIIDSDYKYFDSDKGPDINTVISIFKGRTGNREGQMIFARFHENFEKVPYRYTDVDKIRDNGFAKIIKYKSSNNLLEDYKWGILLSSEEKFIDLLEILKKKGIKPCNVEGLKIGQGLNLTNDYVVNRSVIERYPFVEKALIPFMTNEDGAPFILDQTYNYLIDKSLLNKKEIKQIDRNEIKLFDPSSTTKDKPKLILPRGIGRHFCAINKANAYSSSYVDIYQDRINKKQILNLWAFLNSSICWLIREVSGRKNLGGGMLKAEAIDLKAFPLLYDFDKEVELKRIHSKLADREAKKSIEELETLEHQKIDDIVFDHLGLKHSMRNELLSLLKQKIIERETKSKTS